MKVYFMGVENPTNLELPVHIFTQDLPFFFYFLVHVLFIFASQHREISLSVLI